MKNLATLLIFVALATLFHQNSSIEIDIKDEIFKAYDKPKEKLNLSGKSKSFVPVKRLTESFPY
jgi:hypothetical protein